MILLKLSQGKVPSSNRTFASRSHSFRISSRATFATSDHRSVSHIRGSYDLADLPMWDNHDKNTRGGLDRDATASPPTSN